MIVSMSNPQVKMIMHLQAKSRARHDNGIFVAEGLRLVEEIPKEKLVKAYYAQGSDSKVLELAAMLDAEEMDEKVFKKISSTQTPQGILAIAHIPQWTLDDILLQKSECNDGHKGDSDAHQKGFSEASGCPAKTIMILEDIQDPGNLGTIIRTGEGAGIAGILATRKTVDLTNPKTVRSTMGSIFRVPYVVTDDLHETIQSLKQRGFMIYAAALEGSVPYDAPDYTLPSAFLIGNEGNGLTASALAEADKAVRIPMGGKVESLNAAIASAIFMYEARRQKGLI